MSAKTFALVVGEDPSANKVAKAQDLGIPVLDRDGFLELLETGALPVR